MSSDDVLRVEGVSKRFRKAELHDSLRDAIPAALGRLLGRTSGRPGRRGDFWALRDVSFSAARGEVLGIIGHNGAGKSTILKLLVGLLKPTSGTIRVNGSLAALIEIGAGFHPDLTGRENIYLNGAILGLSRAEVAKRFDRIVDFSGLEEFLDMPVKRYSTGMGARLGFSVAAFVDPEVLIVDEVLSVGDFVFQRKCMERMREVVKGGTAVVFVSHRLRDVTGFCNRVLMLDHGRITAEGEPRQVVGTYLTRQHEPHPDSAPGAVSISRLVVRGPHGPETNFSSGDEVWIDVDVTANRPCEHLSVSVYLRDERNLTVFYTSTMRLGVPPLRLQAGETRTVTARLTLHLARGHFLVGALIYRHDLGDILEDRCPLAILQLTSALEVEGVVNLYPEMELQPAEGGVAEDEPPTAEPVGSHAVAHDPGDAALGRPGRGETTR